MTLEERVGQLLLVHFQGLTCNEEAQTLIDQVHVGGFIYYKWANGLQSQEQVCSLSESLQSHAAVPLFIGVDQEGGAVVRLTDGFTWFPGNRALGEIGKPELAEACAYATGCELRSAGININFAPVVDINSNPDNPVIGIRSFSSLPQVVIAMGAAVLRGLERAGCMAVLKHFPGHGDTTLDSHADLPRVMKSRAELEQVELCPFARLAPNAPALMTAHVWMPALDPFSCATLSSSILEGMLRKEWGYEGLIITDSLIMQGALKEAGSVSEAAIRALQAGCDLLLLGGRILEGEALRELSAADILQIHADLVAAVKERRISEERINVSVERILKCKAIYTRGCSLAADSIDSSMLAQEVAASAIHCRGELPSLAGKKVSLVAPEQLCLQWKGVECREGQSLYLIGASGSLPLAAIADEADAIVAFSYDAWKDPVQQGWLNALIESQRKPVILVALGNPRDIEWAASRTVAALATYSPDPFSIRAVLQMINWRGF